jgi:RNA polymerase sigma-70 factor (ECF subfamily)
MARDESDGQLLERYAEHGEEGAFGALYQRHGGSVLAVCRRVLRQEQDAEDVSQGTFLVLARKAGHIPWQASVRSWLCAVAYRLALNAKTATVRQCIRDELPPDEFLDLRLASPLDDVSRRELRQMLDDELHHLPEKYRAPVVLCYLEGKTNEEAARLLGWPAGSMSRRLARARALLRDRLTQRGLALTLFFLCLALAGYLALWGSPTARQRNSPIAVAQVMGKFAQQSDDGPPIDSTLRRLAEIDRLPQGFDAAPLLKLANRTAAAADMLDAHDPGHPLPDWSKYTAEMRRASLDLAAAVGEKNEQRLLLAAARLNASCKQCHETFRH